MSKLQEDSISFNQTPEQAYLKLIHKCQISEAKRNVSDSRAYAYRKMLHEIIGLRGNQNHVIYAALDQAEKLMEEIESKVS